MKINWIRNLSLTALATFAVLSDADSAQAQNYYGHNHGCNPYTGHNIYSYRPITTLPYYGTNYGVGGYSRGYSSYSSNYGGLNQFGGGNGFNGGYGVGGFPIGSSYGGGAFPRGGSYGGGSFPRGGSYGGGAFPRGGSYGGGGVSITIGR